jgi:hypothetical protein
MFEKQQTQPVWEADLGSDGRKLSIPELQALEAMHVCQLSGEMAKALRYAVLQLESLERRFDRLEQYLLSIDARYPRSAQPNLDHAALVAGPKNGAEA